MNQEGNSPATRHISFIVVIAFALFCAGCHTATYKKGDGAGKSLHHASRQIAIEQQRIDEAVAALDVLVNQPQPDLKPQFARFNRAVDRLVASAEDVERTRRRMEQKSAAYFAEWDETMPTIHYERIREQSEARRAAVTNQFHAVNTRYLEAHEVVGALINYLRDIRTALSLDLTRAGLESVKDIAGNAEQNAARVRLALGRLSDELATSGAALSTVLRESPPAQGTQETRVTVRSELPME